MTQPPHATSPLPSRSTSGALIEMDVLQLFAAVRRQIWIVAVCCLFSLGLGYVYLQTASPQYTASTDIMIDPRRINAVSDAYATPGLGTNSAAIDNEVEVIQSDRVALRVVDALRLGDDPVFQASEPSLAAQLGSLARRYLNEALDHLAWLAPASARASTPGHAVSEFVSTIRGFLKEPPAAEGSFVLSEEDRALTRESASRRLRRNLVVSRRSSTFIIRISYTSGDREEAARLANAYADAFVAEHLETSLDAAQRAGEWLQSRIHELEQRSLEADLAVERFRAENDLIGAGDQPLNEQQLAALNAQRANARAETVHLAARLQRVDEILQSGDVAGTITESLQHSIITHLRSRYLEASKRLSELEARLRPDHQILVKLRADMKQYERLMMDELRRVAESHRSDHKIATAREEELELNLRELVQVAERKNQGLVALRELERKAQSYRNLHQTLLDQHQSATQQQSFEISEAKVINRARPPSSPSQPQSAIIMALALAFGSTMGAGIGAVREYRDRGFRTREQVRDELGLEVLGLLPLVSSSVIRRGRRRRTAPPQGEFDHLIRDVAPLMRYAVDAPVSPFAETLRNAKVAADLALADQAPKIIGVVSVLPGEGKSTVAKNFASLLASQGANTLLIDGDLRKPDLTQHLAPQAQQGLIEAVVDGRPLESLLYSERETQLELLPAIRRQRFSYSGEVLASGGMRAVLHQAGDDFNYIVVDLPPLGAVVDVRAAAARFDAFLLVVEWGATPRSLVRDILREDEAVWSKCLGVIFNKTSSKEIKKYEGCNAMRTNYLYN